MTGHISPPATNFLVYRTVVQLNILEYQGQTRNKRISVRKPLINTPYRILHRLELKYFHFAQFLLNAHGAAHQPPNSEN